PPDRRTMVHAGPPTIGFGSESATDFSPVQPFERVLAWAAYGESAGGGDGWLGSGGGLRGGGVRGNRRADSRRAQGSGGARRRGPARHCDPWPEEPAQLHLATARRPHQSAPSHARRPWRQGG